MFTQLDQQSNYGNSDSDNHTEPGDDKDILVQDMLAHFTYEFMFIGDDVFDVLCRLMDLAKSE